MLAFSQCALKRVAFQLSGKEIPTISLKGTDQRLEFCASCRSDSTCAVTTSVSYRTERNAVNVHNSAFNLSWYLGARFCQLRLPEQLSGLNLKPLLGQGSYSQTQAVSLVSRTLTMSAYPLRS